MKKSLQLESISKWLPTASKPIIISGPCSAETEEQTVATAKQLAATGKSTCTSCRYLETSHTTRSI